MIIKRVGITSNGGEQKLRIANSFTYAFGPGEEQAQKKSDLL
jgi:hypothetical protein